MSVRNKRAPKGQSTTLAPASSKPPPSPAEQKAIENATRRVAERLPRLVLEVEKSSAGVVTLDGPPHNDFLGWLNRLKDTFGTSSRAFAVSQLNHIMTACQDKAGNLDASKVNGMVAAVEGSEPANELQGMLAVQMAVTHLAAMDVLRRAQRVDQISQVDSAGNLAVKLLRTYTMQAETLAKLQRGGEQVVKVVHVHPGGQAIIGDVVGHSGATGAIGDVGPRGGGSGEKSNQPHAKAELPAPNAQPMSEMWGDDAVGQTVPIACGEGQGSMPDARRSGR